MIRREWLRYYDKLPERTYRTRIIQSWRHRRKGWRPERLVGLHNVDAGRQSLLFDRSYARTLRVSKPKGN